MSMMIDRFVEELLKEKEFKDQVVHRHLVPSRKAETGKVKEGFADEIRDALADMGIKSLYSHQARAIEAIRAGKNVVVTTPTASGKTMCYNLPVFERILKGNPGYSLYLFPIKTLGQDQLKVIKNFGLGEKARAEIYDGDTKQYRRGKIRDDPPQILISNPDMIHLSLLPNHAKWEKVYRDLRMVVVDELHTYKGVFGSHVAGVLRRLRRVAAHYGSAPQFVMSSATIANPGDLARALTGLEFEVIATNGAPASGRLFLFINPTASPYTLAAKLFVRSILAGFKTIAFTKARIITELLHTWTMQMAPELGKKISSYRAGFLPEERREIERKLFSGELAGVISTSALEVGVDIGGLDVCILVGYPGTIVTTWQRSGRVGRGDRESLVALIAGRDALDQYFMRHPDDFFGRSVESAVTDPKNRYILGDHLVCAAAELPLQNDDKIFDTTAASEILREQEGLGRLLRRADETGWVSSMRNPQRGVDIRSIGENYTIFEEDSLRVIGSVSGGRALSEVHEGAIYLHRAQPHLITKLDHERANAYAREVRVKYYTKALSDKETEILEVLQSRPTLNFLIRLGRLKVTEKITGYEKRHTSTQERLSTHPLDLPPRTFETVGLWWEIEDFVADEVKRRSLDFMGGIHATEHAAIALFPLFATCDRDDVGGISYPMHPQVKKGAIFIYDGYPGGVGLSERAYEVIEDLLKKTLELIETCECETGCPSCIHSPKCGSGNVPLDKQAAILILKLLLGLEKPEMAPEISEPHEIEIKKKVEERERQHRVVVFDLETQRSPDEVGGWNNTHLMRMAVGVTWDSIEQKFESFLEEDVQKLINKLKSADLVVGFNLIRFDYGVLSAYTAFNLKKLPTFDILLDIASRLGHRLSLDSIVKTTLKKPKLADGVQSLAWFKEGKMDKIIEYCISDVELTRDIFEFGLEKHYLLYERREVGDVRLPVDWNLPELVRKASA